MAAELALPWLVSALVVPGDLVAAEDYSDRAAAGHGSPPPQRIADGNLFEIRKPRDLAGTGAHALRSQSDRRDVEAVNNQTWHICFYMNTWWTNDH